MGLCDASEYDEKYKKWRYEDLPIVPECWKHKILEGTKKQFGILKKLMRDSKVDEVICATDAGREGELIFRLVYEQAGCSACTSAEYSASGSQTMISSSVIRKQLVISLFAENDLPEPGVPRISPFGFFKRFRSTMIMLLDNAFNP